MTTRLALQSRVRRGKIGRLPHSTRSEINRRIRDGQSDRRILEWLNDQPDVKRVMREEFDGQKISYQNLSKWRKDGYQDWLSKREVTERIIELSREALSSGLPNLASDAGSAMAAAHLVDILSSFSVTDFKKLQRKDPAAYASILRALGDLEKIKQASRKLAIEEARFQRETAELLEKFFNDKKAREIVASGADREIKLERLIKLMFGEKPATEGRR